MKITYGIRRRPGPNRVKARSSYRFRPRLRLGLYPWSRSASVRKGSVDDADAGAATSAADADDADDPIDNRGNYKGSDSELGAVLKECFFPFRAAPSSTPKITMSNELSSLEQA